MPDDKSKPVRITASQLRRNLAYCLEQTQYRDAVFEIRGRRGIRGYLVTPTEWARREAQGDGGDDGESPD